MATKIQLRGDSAANWTSANPILSEREMGIETDTQKFKFGDGSTEWADLDYVNTGGGGGGAVDSVNGQTGVVVLDATDVGADASGAATTAENNAKAYADTLVVGLWDDRGNFDASGGAYPSSGGSGSAGAIKKGDIWTISVAGTLPTGQVVEIGDTVRAKQDTPGNTQANWAIQQNNIGYVPENQANKEDAVIDTSTTKYPTNRLVKENLDLKADADSLGSAAFEDTSAFDADGSADAALVAANSYTDSQVLTSFEELDDTFTFSGKGGLLPNVNSAGTALEAGKGFAPASTFASALTFDIFPSKDLGSYNMSSGNLVLTVAGSGNLLHAGIMFTIIANGTGSITFSGSGWDSNARYNITSGDVLAAGTYRVYMIYGANGVQVSIPGNVQFTATSDNSTIEGTGSASLPFKVKDAGVTNAKLANMATKTYKGRTTAGTGVPEDVAAATVLSDIGGVPTSRTISGQALTGNIIIPVEGYYIRSGNYYPLTWGKSPTAAAVSANTLRAWPIIVNKTITFGTLLSEVTTAVGSSTYRIGIYTDNGSGYPDALVANSDGGNIDSAAAAAVRTTNLAGNVTLTPGLYWLAFNCTHTPTLRTWTALQQIYIGGTLATTGFAPIVGWSVALTYAAMPATFTGGGGGMNTGATASACPMVPALIV